MMLALVADIASRPVPQNAHMLPSDQLELDTQVTRSRAC